MCGIFVVINKKSKPLNLKHFKEALDKMKRRGPLELYKNIAPNIFMGQVTIYDWQNQKI